MRLLQYSAGGIKVRSERERRSSSASAACSSSRSASPTCVSANVNQPVDILCRDRSARAKVRDASARALRIAHAVGEGQHGAPSQPPDLARLSSRSSTASTSCTATAQFRDDPAIVAGFAILRGRAVMAIGQQRGRDTKENLRRNFGMVDPRGLSQGRSA